MLRPFFLALTLFTLQPTATIAADTQPSVIHVSDRLPSLSTVKQTMSMIWNWVSTLFNNIVNKLGLRRMPPVLKEMYATRVQREHAFAQKYLSKNIPAPIAHIAGVLDRMEEDYKKCRSLLHTEDDPMVRKSLNQEIDKIDTEVDVYMDSVEEQINEADEHAFKTRNAELVKFIQVLKTRSFLELMLDDIA